jgi:menaquinone-dependent protoporphyrinogen IX oxidase
MKGLIIYRSKDGSTKQYAEWLSADTGFEITESKDVKTTMIQNYDMVLIGCPIHANKPILANWVKSRWKVLRDKKLIFYTTSGAPSDDPKLQEWYKKTFSEEIREKMNYFPLGGRFIVSELKGLMKFLMNFAMKMEKDPKVREEMGRDIDNVKRESINPIIDFIKSVE